MKKNSITQATVNFVDQTEFNLMETCSLTRFGLLASIYRRNVTELGNKFDKSFPEWQLLRSGYGRKTKYALMDYNGNVVDPSKVVSVISEIHAEIREGKFHYTEWDSTEPYDRDRCASIRCETGNYSAYVYESTDRQTYEHDRAELKRMTCKKLSKMLEVMRGEV